ncbi:hypothetical protein SNE40_020275 [Patella caerulea]|uniref:non-specific serine/threonine protein kinase n=1 Tax=Patella caerulea TaxID=87958 RepID=A0AAN8J4L8_PATCE
MDEGGNKDGWPGQMLHQAALYNNKELMICLLEGEEKVNMNCRDVMGRTCVYTAVSNNSDECLKVLLQNGADPNITAGKRYNGMTPLHCAICDNKICAIKLLLSYKADLYISDDTGSTPLSLAKVVGSTEACLLLEEEMEKRRLELLKITESLNEAIMLQDVARVKDILRLAGPQSKNVLKFIPENNTPLLCSAALVGNCELLELLIEVGAAPVAHPISAMSPLHYACEGGHNSALVLLLKMFPEFCNSLTSLHELPIHIAAAHGNSEIVCALLHYSYPATLLHTYEIGQIKYKAPFDMNAVESNGYTPLHIACERGHAGIVKDLLQYTVTAEAGNIHDAMTSSFLSEFQSLGDLETLTPQIQPININCLTSTGLTPLHIAVKNKHHEVAEVLLLAEADVNIMLRKQSPSMSLALYALKESDYEMLRILLTYGLEDVDNKALSYAIYHNKTDKLLLLLQFKSSKCHHHSINRSELRRVYSQIHASEKDKSKADESKEKQSTTAVSLNWQGLKVLSYISEDCIIGACLLYNPFMSHQDRDVIFTAITRVDISENSFDKVPLILFELPSLCVINMSYNEIESFPSEADFSENVKSFALEEINLHHNRLKQVPSYLFKLPNLSFVNLSQNKLTELPLEIWTAPALVHLNAASNKLKTLPYMQWDEVFMKQSNSTPRGSLSSSLRFDISYSGSSAEPEWLAFERRSEISQTDSMAPQDVMENEVMHINQWSTKVTVIDHDSKSNHNNKGIRKLELHKNLFKEIPVCLACCAPNLEYLDISMNPLLSVGTLSDLPVNLQELNLSWTGISDLSPWIQTLSNNSEDQPCYGSNCKPINNTSSRMTPTFHKSSPSIGSRDSFSTHSILQAAYCPHRLHSQLNNLEKLNLSVNKLKNIELMKPANKEMAGSENSSVSSLGLESEDIQGRLLFPHLNELDLSSNQLKSLPAEIGDLVELKVLNLSKNTQLKELPPKLGLLKKLWKLELELCPLDGTIQDLLKNSRYQVKDILGFLLSILEESTEYNSMNLMFVGSHKMGKTSLLERMRREGKSSNKATHWRDRVSDNPVTGRKGEILSTVGIDINDLVIDRKSKGPVHFRTWDFGGQREYYATHQYFLSPRSLYLVIWNIVEGEKGVESLLQWLINIQARAPGTSVIIVGTHLDILKDKTTRRNYPPDFEEAMTGLIFKTFINEQEPDKSGLPLIRDVVNLSCKTGENVRKLVDSIYEHAFDLHHPKSRSQKLLKQKIPKKYLLLQDIVRELARERILEHKDPVLIKSKYMLCVSNKMIEKEEKTFRDVEELAQATRFLHENGVLFHYEDLPLRDMYFLDPQWLCDQLAKVITVREVNTFAPRGIMQIENLKFLFKSSAFQHDDIQKYITNLLGKFEVALQFDDKNLLLPSLLPKEKELRTSIIHKTDIRIPVRRSEQTSVNVKYAVLQSTYEERFTIDRQAIPSPISVGKSQFYTGPQTFHNCSIQESPLILLKMKPSCNPIFSFTRLYFMTYIPSGFWPRLITRVLADSTLFDVITELFELPPDLLEKSEDVRALSGSNPDWRCWQTGLELLHYGFEMLRIREVFMNSPVSVCDYAECRIKCAVDSEWGFLDIYRSKILEITFPTDSLTFHLTSDSGSETQVGEYTTTILRDDSVAAKLIVKIVEHIDNLLQDWYPDLGELRFHQTCEGRYLVTRVVLCPQCLHEEVKRQKNSDKSDAWYFLDPDVPEVRARRIGPEVEEVERRDSFMKTEDVGGDTMDPEFESLMEGQSMLYNKKQEEGIIYSFFVERCMLDCLEGLNECCPVHGSVSPAHMIDEKGVSRTFYIAPDVVFHDISSDILISESDVLVKGEDLGKGTFGDVYAGQLIRKGEGPSIPIAMKILFTSSKQNNLHMGVQARLDRASQAYLIARQEISILENIKHPHTVPLLGLQRHPLCLVLSLAPMGALDHYLRDLSRNGQLLPLFVIRKVIIQVSQAVAYLHAKHIIYRDLKSENVLVWALSTSADAKPFSVVDVKIADYGISRSVLPSGAKGFGGTPPFIAPEILQHAGKDTYTEKVDIFSFGMFMYELLTCRQPLIEMNSPSSYICQGGRPTITSQDVNLYPSYMLDVMTISWSHDPIDRPSADNIVSISTSPQFIHLRDAVSLGPDVGILCGLVIPCTDSNLTPLEKLQNGIDDDSDDTSIDKDMSNYIWLSTKHRTGCSIEVLGFNQWNHCVSSKTVSVSGTEVSALTVVEDLVWCADSNGFITIICSKSHKLLRQFALPIKNSSNVYVVGLNYFPKLKQVVAVVQTGELYTLNTRNGQLLDLDINEYSTDTSLCSVQIQNKKQNEIWLGQSSGKIGIWDVNKCCMIGELESCDSTVSKRTFCMFMVAGQPQYCEETYIWSYSYPGSVILRWNTVQRKIVNRLDISQVLSSLDNKISTASKCQVTALNVSGRYLYIGTTLGSFIVADALTLANYNVVKCHIEKEFYIKCILPLLPVDDENSDDKGNIIKNSPGIVTVGKGYIDLVRVSPNKQDTTTKVKDNITETDKLGPALKDPLLHHTFMLSWHAENWEYS